MSGPLRVLVTAGHTEEPIDSVRNITNIFKGKTGTGIAWGLHNVPSCYGYHSKDREMVVTLLTSNPEIFYEHHSLDGSDQEGVHYPFVKTYKYFDELAALMEDEIRNGQSHSVRSFFHAKGEVIPRSPYDVIIHSSAVNDYKKASVLIPDANGCLQVIDSSKKVSGSHPEMYLKLVPTMKLIDQIREPWGFKGKLIKFKLQVGISDAELIDIAKGSLVVSKADYIVANCLEWAKERAYIIGADGSCENVTRANLPAALKERL